MGFRASPEEHTVIRTWYVSSGEKEKAKFDSTLKFLVERPRREWTKPAQNPRYKPLDPPFDGFGEIRFEVRNIQHRPIGFFSASDEFTILEFATERNDRFPPGLEQKIKARRQLVSGNKGRHTHEWRIVV